MKIYNKTGLVLILMLFMIIPAVYGSGPDTDLQNGRLPAETADVMTEAGTEDYAGDASGLADGVVKIKASGNWKGVIQDITAGTALAPQLVKAIGEDLFFYVEEIDDRTFARMWGKSYKEYCTVPREELRYIRCLHKDIDGKIKVGELVMNKAVADVVCDIFRQLYDASFPIESMLLVDEFDASDEASIMVNNTSAFNFRMVDNTNQISQHAYGLAIDINPYYNVYYIPSANYIFPPEGWEYLDRNADFPYKVGPGDLCYELFTAAGFEWGGWWTYNTDYQHFQYPLDVSY